MSPEADSHAGFHGVTWLANFGGAARLRELKALRPLRRYFFATFFFFADLPPKHGVACSSPESEVSQTVGSDPSPGGRFAGGWCGNVPVSPAHFSLTTTSRTSKLAGSRRQSAQLHAALSPSLQGSPPASNHPAHPAYAAHSAMPTGVMVRGVLGCDHPSSRNKGACTCPLTPPNKMTTFHLGQVFSVPQRFCNVPWGT